MVIDDACMGILFNQGQVCCAKSRIFVQDTFYDKFVDALIKEYNSVKVGNSMDKKTMMDMWTTLNKLFFRSKIKFFLGVCQIWRK